MAEWANHNGLNKRENTMTITTAGIQVSYIREVTEGITPNAAAQALNVTSETLTANIDYTTSNAIRATRGVVDRIATGEGAEGTVETELSFAQLKPLLEMALMNTFGAVTNVTAATIAAAAGDNSITASTGTPFNGVVPGQYVLVSGFANAANNGYKRVATATNTKLTFSTGAMVTESAGPSVKVKGQILRDGATKQPATYQVQLATALFKRMVGAKVNTMEFSFSLGEIATASVDLIGLQTTEETTLAGNGTVTPAAVEKMFNALTSFTDVLFNGAAATFELSEFNLALNNNLSQDRKLGSRRAADVPLRSFEVSGSFTAYFNNFAINAIQRNDQVRDLTFVMKDADGNGYAVTIPNLKITNVNNNATGRDDTLMQEVEFGAVEIGGFSIQIDAFPAA